MTITEKVRRKHNLTPARMAAIRQRLIMAHAEPEDVRPAEIWRMATDGAKWHGCYPRGLVGGIAHEINKGELRDGRPILSGVIDTKDGVLKCLEALGLTKPGDTDESLRAHHVAEAKRFWHTVA